MNVKRSNRDEVRNNNLSVPMTKAEHESVSASAKREGMTKTAYCRSVFNAASKVSLARLIILIENEVQK